MSQPSDPSTAAPSTPAGEVRIEGEQATLVFQRQLKHSPEAVWQAITDPAALKHWFMTAATVEHRAGGALDMVSGTARFHWTGKVLTWDPPRVYEYEWNTEPRAELPRGEKTVVRWALEPRAGGTLLTLTHRMLTRPTALGFAPGTHAFLDRLEAHLAGESLPDWMGRYAAVKHAYPAWTPPGR